jgi:hypothetical protein
MLRCKATELPHRYEPVIHDPFIDNAPSGTSMPDLASGPGLVWASLLAFPELPQGDERR